MTSVNVCLRFLSNTGSPSGAGPPAFLDADSLFLLARASGYFLECEFFRYNTGIVICTLHSTDFIPEHTGVQHHQKIESLASSYPYSENRRLAHQGLRETVAAGDIVRCL
jgi:hypothetical protein